MSVANQSLSTFIDKGQEMKPHTEYKNKVSFMAKLGFSTVTAVVLSAGVVSTTNALPSVTNTPREVRTYSPNAPYTVSSTVYTGKKVSNRTEAVHMIKQERPFTVEVEFENLGYVEHKIKFAEDEDFEDEYIKMIHFTTEPLIVEAEVENQGYKVHYVHFTDEVE